MKKTTILPLIAALSCGSFVHAGTMGPVTAAPCLTSFLALEGGYTWNEIKNYHFNLIGLDSSFYSHQNNNGFSGRLSAGIIRPIKDQFALSSEIGYGYYGRTKLNPRATGVLAGVPGNLHIKNTLSGFDALVGVAYTTTDYSLFLKAGALVQNWTRKTNADFSTLGLSTFNTSTNHTAVLPELKVGGAYNIDNNWALTASYLHAFGENPRATGNLDINTLNTSLRINTQNPSIDSVMLGVQYSI